MKRFLVSLNQPKPADDDHRELDDHVKPPVAKAAKVESTLHQHHAPCNSKPLQTVHSIFPSVKTPSSTLPKLYRSPAVNGLIYIRNFISREEEAELVRFMDDDSQSGSWGTFSQRRVKEFSPAHTSYARLAQPKPQPRPMTDLLQKLSKRVAHTVYEATHEARHATLELDHAFVIEYTPGQGIASHTDYNDFQEIVATLSLLSPLVMQYNNSKSENGTGKQPSSGPYNHVLEARSLSILSGEARYQWMHGIAARKTDRLKLKDALAFPALAGLVPDHIERKRRISITFRTRMP